MSLRRFNESYYGHFVTSRTFKNKQIFSDDSYCQILLRDLDYYRQKLSFQLLGYVIMPNHVHFVIYWDVEENPGLTISKIMHDIKGLSAQNLSNYLLDSRGFYASTNYPQAGSRGVSASTSSQGAKALATRGGDTGAKALATQDDRRTVMKIWQPSFYDFNIYSEEKLREKLNYIHYNSVKTHLCDKPEDYKWSSYRFYQFGEKGIIKIDKL